jgi:hypothetical protein
MASKAVKIHNQQMRAEAVEHIAVQIYVQLSGISPEYEKAIEMSIERAEMWVDARDKRNASRVAGYESISEDET